MLCLAGFIMSRALDFQSGSLTDYANVLYMLMLYHVLRTFQCTKNIAVKKKQILETKQTKKQSAILDSIFQEHYWFTTLQAWLSAVDVYWGCNEGFAFPAEKDRGNSHHKPTSPSIRALTSENSTLWVLTLSPGNGISPSQRPVRLLPVLGPRSGLCGWCSGKESACNCRRHGFGSWVGKILWRRKW